jgi:hypothetical protein
MAWFEPVTSSGPGVRLEPPTRDTGVYGILARPPVG